MEAPPNLSATAHPIESNEEELPGATLRPAALPRSVASAVLGEPEPWRRLLSENIPGSARLAFTNFSIISRKQAMVDKPVLDDIPRRYTLKLSKK